MLLFMGFLKILGKNNKVHSDDDDVLEEELLKYLELNKKKINYMVIAGFKNKLAALNRILSYKNKIHKIRCLNFKREEQVKDELNNLKLEKDEELELLQENLNSLTLRNTYLRRSNSFRGELELEEKIEKRADGIEKLKKKKVEELEKFFIMDVEHIDLLLELDNDERYIQEQLILIEIKLEELKMFKKQLKQLNHKLLNGIQLNISRINNIIILILKLQSLIVGINYALLGFYLCHFRMNECIKRPNCI